MSALSHVAVGQYLNRHYVSAFQKVATFQLNGGQKQGGNVAGYFCTPQGHVLSAIAGPVNEVTFLQEARWANETYQLALLGNPAPEQVQVFFRKAHIARLPRQHHASLHDNALPHPDTVTAKHLDRLLAQNQHLGLNAQGQVHLMLAVGAMPRLDQVYQAVFERILNEKISTDPVRVNGPG